MTEWAMKRIETEREYEITDAPDLQDSSSSRRLVIRPRRVTLRQLYGTNRVRGAVIEGRLVRRDGELGGSRQILAGICAEGWSFDAQPPAWLNEILADDGLEWTADPKTRV